MGTPLQRLAEQGQSIWIDFISRDALQSGQIGELIADRSVTGLTSNPTIFDKAISAGHAYDEQIRELLEERREAKDVFLALAQRDIREACDLLHSAWERSDGCDGYASIEVDPTLAHDAQATIDEARMLHDLVDRPNVFVKIPATREGLAAIEESIAAGISINVTLIFSLQRHAEVIDAYLRGLERLVESGGDPSKIASVASFFVSRVDTETDKRLDAIGGQEQLKGRLAVANAKLAYQTFKERFTGERWQALADRGARVQRCLWASTSTKNPDYSDVLYIDELIGPDTVNTMPLATLEAFDDHGTVELTLERGLDEARGLLAELAAAGVDYDDVTATLERDGIEIFAKSFADMLDGVARKQAALVA